ncbi:Retrovirus-related Pol polyprotein from transposon opus [Araneus ventricosus]|uniref:RNA-directed DNA polymerase n=1 Tax=Araneus ventricosus TaxID=182803 RepID=A0A4Y2FKM9_ARAVE|nr:Retrovirus-related Pol polyprotein from transposon opus [Araneus ventricosus]
MSFGLRNAPSTFQRFITEVLFGLDFVFPYLDDVLVASSSEEEHKEHLKMVFDRFQQYGLRINISKSVMGADQVEYLGYLITAEGSRPLPEKVEAITNYKLPTTIHELRTFLGMINFYRRYLKEAAKTQAPLHEMLKGAKKKDRRKVPWTDDTIKCFEKCKADLAEAALLSFPRYGLPLSLCTDASDFAHIQGKDNVVADALSRIEAVSTIDYDAIAEKQLHDEELQQLMQNNSSLKFKPSTLPSGKILWCDISTSNIRPYIPQQFRLQMFQQIHGFCHPGIKTTIKQMTEKFIWSDMKKQVGEWAKTCIRCQKCKVNRHTKSKFGEYQVPDARFSVVHIDLIGPLPPSEGMEYCLTCIDRFSSWMEAVPLPDITAEIVGRAFYNHWVSRFGVPAQIITDQGRQFESHLFRRLVSICGAKVSHTTSYHPQCNGKIERLHRTLKGAIKVHDNIRWTESLPTVLLGLRAAIRPDTNHSIAQMVYGTTIKLPGEFFDPPTIRMNQETFVSKLQKFMEELKPMPSTSVKHQILFVHKDLRSCSYVFVRIDRVKKALEPPYKGPYVVVERFGKYFTVLVKDKHVNITIDRLKPAYLLATDKVNDKPCKHSDAKDSHLSSNTQTTSRCGRHVKRPVRFRD